MRPLERDGRETAYERHKATALRVLRRRCPWLAPDEREGTYHDAYATLLEKHREGALDMEAMHDAQVRAYLLTAAVHRGLREGERAERRLAVPTEDAGVHVAEPSLPVEEMVAVESALGPLRELVEELPERRRAVIKLRFWLDRSPAEIKAFLGISERTYRRELERAFGQLAERYELVREGRWCEERRSLVLAYVAGVAGPRRTREARLHLESCPGCARMVVDLRRAAERVAALLPFPELASGEGWLSRLAELGPSIRDQLADVGASAKGHAASVLARADPAAAQYTAGARPGAAVAAIASCVAIGGGATYCAVEGLPDPVRELAQIERQEQDLPDRRESHEPDPRSSGADVAPPVLADSTPTAQQEEPTPAEPVEPEPTPSTPAAEFDPGTAVTSSPTAPPRPADQAGFGASPASPGASAADAGEFAP